MRTLIPRHRIAARICLDPRCAPIAEPIGLGRIRPLEGVEILEEAVGSWNSPVLLSKAPRVDAAWVIAGSLPIGALVVIDPYRGVRRRGMSYTHEDRDVIFLGRATTGIGEVVKIPIEECVMATLNPENLSVASPMFDWVLIDRGELAEESAGGIALPESARSRECLAKVVAKGPQATQVEPGDTVVYMATVQKERLIDGVVNPHVFVREGAILAVISDGDVR